MFEADWFSILMVIGFFVSVGFGMDLLFRDDDDATH